MDQNSLHASYNQSQITLLISVFSSVQHSSPSVFNLWFPELSISPMGLSSHSHSMASSMWAPSLRWIRGICGFLNNLTAFVAMLEKKRTVGVNEKPVVCITFIREAKTHGEALTHTNESRKSEIFQGTSTLFPKSSLFGAAHVRLQSGKKNVEIQHSYLICFK